MKLVITQNITLDGVIEVTETTGDWFGPAGGDTDMSDLDGDLLGAVRDLKAKPGSTLGVTGSISVCHALIAADLVDEYRLFVYPTVIGHARRLFDGDAAGPHDLELVTTEPFRSGIVLLTYRPHADR